MAIDKSGGYWYGGSSDDIKEFLVEYSEGTAGKLKEVKCGNCL
jgi:hypothetical protein